MCKPSPITSICPRKLRLSWSKRAVGWNPSICSKAAHILRGFFNASKLCGHEPRRYAPCG